MPLRRPILLCLLLATLAGCGRHEPTDVDALSRPASPQPQARTVDPATHGPGSSPLNTGPGRWSLQPGPPPRALWAVADSEPMLVIDCDTDRGRLKLAVDATGLPADTRMLALHADSTQVDYPADPLNTTLRTELVTHIALDAPMLDRMLAAPELTVIAGGRMFGTGSPATALAAVVSHCRARH